MLDIKDLNVYYSGIHALKGINLKVKENSIVSLIGANGAGKSTTLKAIMNMTKYNGNIDFSGKKLSSMKTKDIVKEGFTLVPEGRRVFSNLTVYENLLLGAYSRKDKEIQKDINKIYDIFPRLKERKDQKGGTMSGGEQQMLAIGRALMSRPRFLMMDEPSLGLAPLIVKDIFNIIKEIHSGGVTILLIEQNAKAALEIADYGYVLETGNIVLEGEGKALLHDERVKSAYLGEESI